MTKQFGKSMVCPKCKGPTHVYESRGYGDNVLRRRICKACKTRGVTVETYVTDYDRQSLKELASTI